MLSELNGARSLNICRESSPLLHKSLEAPTSMKTINPVSITKWYGILNLYRLNRSLLLNDDADQPTTSFVYDPLQGVLKFDLSILRHPVELVLDALPH